MNLIADPQQAFHRGTAAIFSLLTPEQTRQLANLTGDPELVPRLTQLADKADLDEPIQPEPEPDTPVVQARRLAWAELLRCSFGI